MEKLHSCWLLKEAMKNAVECSWQEEVMSTFQTKYATWVVISHAVGGLEYSLELWSLIDGLLGFYRIKILVRHVLHKNDLPQIVSSKAMSFFQFIWGNDRKGNERNKGLSQQDGRYSTLLC